MNAAKKSIATTKIAGSLVHVVGGGIGGLTAALAFADRGAGVTVFEQAHAFSEVGAGIQITPNAMRVFKALGIADDVTYAGVVSDAVEPMNGLTGRTITQFSLTSQSPRYLFIHRARLIDILVTACRARGVQLQTNAPVSDPHPDGTFAAQGARQTQSDLTIYADGLHSKGRPMITGSADAPFFTGQVAWRAIVPGTMPAKAQIAMGPGRHMVIYPLGLDQINLVAVQERNDWAAEGWNHADDPANLRRAFKDFAPQFKTLLDEVETTNLWGLFRHPVADTWFTDKSVLLGDAAHPTLPFLAQGANMAIEDGYVLARNCTEHGLRHGLQNYQSARKPRVTRAIAAANANAKNYHLRGAKKLIAHAGLKTLGTLAPNAFLNRLAWLYDQDVTH